MANTIESLARSLATKNSTSIKSEKAKVTEVLSAITDAISEGDVILKDFGRFHSVERSVPKALGSKERIKVKSLAFKAFDSLKSRVK